MDFEVITRTYQFNYSTFKYDVLDVETTEENTKFIVGSFTMGLYVGKTNIPVVPRKSQITMEK